MDRKKGVPQNTAQVTESTKLETHPTSGLAILIINFLIIQYGFVRFLFLATKSTLTIWLP